MGMAASQSRYLGLTARKINVEYEGQQVNQQRTALANESAGLFRQLMGLEVPTAPSQAEYYETQYVYNDPINGKTVLSSIDKNEGSDPVTYTVVTTYEETVKQFNSYKDYSVTAKKDSETNATNIFLGEEMVGPFKLSKEQEMSATLASCLNSAEGQSEIVNSAGDKYFTFTHSSGAVYYINATKTGFNVEDYNNAQIVDFVTELKVQEERNNTIENAQLSTTSAGAYNKLYWTDEKGHHSFSLSQSQKYNETGYNDAMAKYNADKQVYEQTVAEINAKTKKLEETDRTLELRLKQLDTEQQALQTEMESVKKVIDKSIDNVFKTFQS